MRFHIFWQKSCFLLPLPFTGEEKITKVHNLLLFCNFFEGRGQLFRLAADNIKLVHFIINRTLVAKDKRRSKKQAHLLDLGSAVLPFFG